MLTRCVDTPAAKVVSFINRQTTRRSLGGVLVPNQIAPDETIRKKRRTSAGTDP